MPQLELDRTLKLLEKYKLPFAKLKLAKSPEQALKIAKELKFPVVLKVYSQNIIHKTDINGVRTNIEDEKQLLEAYEDILKQVKKKSKAKIEGIIVQKTEQGLEVVIGAKQDPQFGPVIMFGIGGVLIEVLKDVVFRIAPINSKEAESMLEEIKAKQILEGVRGKKPINKKALVTLLVKTSKLITEKKNIQELDFNPIMVNDKSAIIADPRIIVE
jgi:acyl-CoA synthetase (NDP forming)